MHRANIAHKECEWKDGDRGGLAEREQTEGKKKQKCALTSTGLLMEGPSLYNEVQRANPVLDSLTVDEAMKFFVIGLIIVSFLPSKEQQKPTPATFTRTCHEFSFEGRVNGGAEYFHELGGGLSIQLSPSLAPKNENWGWIIQIRPLDSADDYAFPVNPPFHSENSQWLSTGYGETLEHQLGYEHEVFFVLNRQEYEHAAKLVEEAMSSADSEAAGKFISALPSLRSAVLRLKPIKYETADGGKTAKWMTFRVAVIAPSELQPAPSLNAKDTACPSIHR